MPQETVKSIVVVEGVFATLVPDEVGGAAVLYWARGIPSYGPALTLVDWEIGQLTPEMWNAVADKLNDLSVMRRARRGVIGIFVESEVLTQYAEARGYPARPIYDHMTAPDAWRGMCVIATNYVREGKVAFTAAALQKRTAPFGALTFRGGPRPENDATVPAFVYGVVLGLDIAAARPPKPARVKVVAV